MKTFGTNTDDGPPPIAIVGMHGRFPGAADTSSFWSNLSGGTDVVGEIPAERWDWRRLHGEKSAQDETSYSRWGGFTEHVDCFDAAFFGILPREAESMDPQQRLFLQTAYCAFEDAGISPRDLAGRKVGVFVGVGNADYPVLMRGDRVPLDAYRGTGMALTAIPNRVSFQFDLRGPSCAVDTACSGSLVALHRAVASLRSGECELALVGGVNLLLGPELYVAFSKAEMLSPTGRCRTFDAGADGYVRGEGVAALVLRPLDAALADSDYVYGLVRGSAENHGGRAHSFTAPNPEAQADVIVEAWKRAGLALGDAAFIESHGTGTPLGDPIEIDGLEKALSLSRGPERPDGAGPIFVSSLKSHIGHLEAAAGIAGVIKAVLSIQRMELPGNLHFERLNPQIDLGRSRLAIPHETVRLQASGAPLLAGVSSFGFGGVNAHVVLEGSPPVQQQGGPEGADRQFLILISARDEGGLRARAAQLLDVARHAAGAIRQGRLERDLYDALAIPRAPDGAPAGLADHAVTPARLIRALDALSATAGRQLGLGDIRDCVTIEEMAERIAGDSSKRTGRDASRLISGTAIPEAAKRSIGVASIARTLMLGREPMSERLALVVRSLSDLTERLDAFVAGADGEWKRFTVRGRGERLAPPGAATARSSERDLMRWAEYWGCVKNPLMPWDHLYPDLPLPAKIPLPAYPFELKRIWYRSTAPAAAVEAEDEVRSRRSGMTLLMGGRNEAAAALRTVSIPVAWRECWNASPIVLPSSLAVLSVLAEHLDRSGARPAAAERIALGRPSDLEPDATVRRSGHGEETVIHCVAEGYPTKALLEGRPASTGAGAAPAPTTDVAGIVEGADFYGMLDRAGFRPDARYRCVRRVAAGRDHLGFEVDLHRATAGDGRFWAALVSTAVMGVGWLLDPALSPSGFGMIWRIGMLRFDGDASEPIVRIDVSQAPDGAISIWACDRLGRPAFGMTEVRTRTFPLAPASAVDLLPRAAGAGR